MGYLTSSGCIGVAFNDGSGLLAAAGLRSCEYRQKSARARSEAGAAGAAVVVPHGGPGAGFTQLAGLDERIGKKLRLLECFARELLGGGGTPLRAAAEIGRGAAEIGRGAISLSRCDADLARCDLARCDLARSGVTRWRRTRHALVCEVGRG